MTLHEFKETLPDVEVTFNRGKTRIKARVGGRKNPFAGLVWINNGVMNSREVAWATVHRCYEQGEAIFV